MSEAHAEKKNLHVAFLFVNFNHNTSLYIIMIHLDILAGRMSFDGKKVSPDARKGILRLLIDVESDLVKIQWLDRSQEPPSVEFEMLAPVTIEPVPSVKTGRVYVIKSLPGFGSSSVDKNFIWIQQQASGNAAGDAAGLASGSVDNVESLINQIQMFAQIPSGKAAAEMHSQIFGDEEDEEDQIQEDQMLVDLRHHGLPPDDEVDDAADEEEFQALMEQLVGEGQLSTDQIAQLLLVNPEIQQILIAQFVLMAANFLALNPAMVETPPPHQHPVEVRDILIHEKALDLLSSDKEVENRLLSLCPPEELSLREIILSPQFGEAVRSLTEGIYSDQISLLFSSLGLDPSQIAPGADPLEALCRALESKFRKPPSPQQ